MQLWCTAENYWRKKNMRITEFLVQEKAVKMQKGFFLTEFYFYVFIELNVLFKTWCHKY